MFAVSPMTVVRQNQSPSPVLGDIYQIVLTNTNAENGATKTDFTHITRDLVAPELNKSYKLRAVSATPFYISHANVGARLTLSSFFLELELNALGNSYDGRIDNNHNLCCVLGEYVPMSIYKDESNHLSVYQFVPNNGVSVKNVGLLRNANIRVKITTYDSTSGQWLVLSADDYKAGSTCCVLELISF